MAIFHFLFYFFLISLQIQNCSTFHCNDIKADHFVASDELFFPNATACLLLLLSSSFYDSILGRKHFTNIKMQNKRCWREVRKERNWKCRRGGGSMKVILFFSHRKWIEKQFFLANEHLRFILSVEICQVSCLKVKFIKCLNVKLAEQLTRESLGGHWCAKFFEVGLLVWKVNAVNFDLFTVLDVCGNGNIFWLAELNSEGDQGCIKYS